MLMDPFQDVQYDIGGDWFVVFKVNFKVLGACQRLDQPKQLIEPENEPIVAISDVLEILQHCCPVGGNHIKAQIICFGVLNDRWSDSLGAERIMPGPSKTGPMFLADILYYRLVRCLKNFGPGSAEIQSECRSVFPVISDVLNFMPSEYLLDIRPKVL